jgi:hypothetical protein
VKSEPVCSGKSFSFVVLFLVLGAWSGTLSGPDFDPENEIENDERERSEEASATLRRVAGFLNYACSPIFA